MMRIQKENSLINIRRNSGRTLEEVSLATEIHIDNLLEYEKNPADIKVSIALKLANTYGVSIDEISFE